MNKVDIDSSQAIIQAHALKKKGNIGEAIALLENINEHQENGGVVRVLASFLMDTLNYQKVVDLRHIDKYDTRNYVLAKSILDGDVCSTAPVCLEGHQPLDKVAFVAMVKDEEDIIFYNLLWHYELGLRKFFLIDNLSTDKTLEYIKLFERLFDDTEVFVLHDPIVAYFQGKKTTGACRFAMTIWDDLEWLILTDADEFLCPTRALHSIFADIPSSVNAIMVPKSFYNLVPGESAEDDAPFFRRIQHRTPVTHVSSKSIMRANLQFSISQGNHRIFDEKGNEMKNCMSSLDLTYREFRMRSYSHYKKKVMNGGQAVEAALRQGFNQVGGGHWGALYLLYKQQGEIGLRRHLEKFMEKEQPQTSLLDPLPIDTILQKMDANCNISNLIL